MPGLRNKKSRLLITGQAASEASASGIRLMAALPKGWMMTQSSEVRTSGT